MVQEMTAKHLAAINRGRKDVGLKPIRMKKKTKEKANFDKTFNMSALKKRLLKVKKMQNKHFIKTNKMDPKLQAEINQIKRRLKSAKSN